MIAGRLHWRPPQPSSPAATRFAAFDFPTGSLVLTEAGSKRRASLHVLRGEEGCAPSIPAASKFSAPISTAFAPRSRSKTAPSSAPSPIRASISGVGNAYSDEILHAAQLSPIALTHKLKPEEWERLFTATRSTLALWMDRLRAEAERTFPERVTAFRPEMAVHGRFGQPCPRCGENVQRIRYADNETNYCARCQTGGKVLADRSLSRLLGSDWPRTLEELGSSEASLTRLLAQRLCSGQAAFRQPCERFRLAFRPRRNCVAAGEYGSLRFDGIGDRGREKSHPLPPPPKKNIAR